MEHKLDVGSGDVIEIDKLYGPTVFADIRIIVDTKSCSWIIERLTTLPCPDPENPNTYQWLKWVEWCRIPAQFDWEFKEE